MVNEVEEYLEILCSITAGFTPPLLNPVHYHLVWLPDAAGHASAVYSALDMVEKMLAAKSERFAKTFENLYIKATEEAGYMRSCLQYFPALSRLNKQVEAEILDFMKFLNELGHLEINNYILGTLAPLILDHMAREECYYLTKLAMVSRLKPPGCDAAKPRITG